MTDEEEREYFRQAAERAKQRRAELAKLAESAEIGNKGMFAFTLPSFWV